MVAAGKTKGVPGGCIRSNGHHSNLQQGTFDEMKLLRADGVRLWPDGFTMACDSYDQRNLIARRPTKRARYPHWFFLNARDSKLPAFERPAEEMALVGI